MTATTSLPQQPQHTFPPHEALPQPNTHQRPIAVPGAQRRDVKQTNGSIESSNHLVNSPAVNGTTGAADPLVSSSKKKKKKKKSKRNSVALVLEEDPTSEAEEPEEFYSDNDLPTATTNNALTAANIPQIYNPETPYLQQNNQATQTDTPANSISPTTSPKKKKKKKKTKSSFVEVPIGMPLNSNVITNSIASQNTSARRFGSGNTSLWTPSTPPEERLKIREFWFQLREDERRSLVKVEKEAVLKKMKEQQKHSCSCSVCGRKRTAIEEELEILYDAYYEELEVYAGKQVEGEGRIYPDFRGNLGEMNDDEEDYDDDDEEEDYEDDEEEDFDDEEEYEDDEDGSEEADGSEEGTDTRGRHTHNHHGNSHTHEHGHDYATVTRRSRRRNGEFNFNFGNSLTVKEGGILTVADDLLKNDGKKFLEMMERLAERRMQKEEEAERDREEYEEDYEDGDEVYDEGEEENDMTDEQRMEEGRRMFQIFAARMFEQRVLTAYREKVARERQAKLLEELEEENRAKQERELKKLKEKEKKKDKKRQQKEQKEQERKEKEAAKQLEEDRLRAEKDKKTEEEQRKREEDKLKREEERRLKEEERLRKEEEKREMERRRKGKEIEKEKKRKEEKEKKEREEREKREREEKQKKEREEKARKDREERERIKKEKEEKVRKESEQHEKDKAMVAAAAITAAATTITATSTTAIQSPSPSTSISTGVPLAQATKPASSSEKRKSVPNTSLTSTPPITKSISTTSSLRTPTIRPMNPVLSPQQPPMLPPGVPAIRPSVRSTSWGQPPHSPYTQHHPGLVNGSPQQLASSVALVNGTSPQAVSFGMPPPMAMGPIIGQPPYIRDQKSPVRTLGIIGPPGVAPIPAISAAQAQAVAGAGSLVSSLGILNGNGSSVVTTSAGMTMPVTQAPQPIANVSTPIPPIGHTRRMSAQDLPVTRVSTPPPLPSSSIKAISRPTPIAKPRRESATSTIGAERRGSSVANSINANDNEAVKGVGSSALDGEIVESLGRDVRGLSLSSVKEGETVPVGVGSYFSGSMFAAPGRVDPFGPTSSFAPPWGMPIPLPRPMGNDPGPWSNNGWGGLPGLATNNVFADVLPTPILHEQIRERVKQVLAKLSTFSHPTLPQAFYPLAQVQHFFLEYFPDFKVSEMDIYSACAQPGTGFTIYQDIRMGLLIRYEGLAIGGTGVIVGPGGVGGVGIVGGEQGPGDSGGAW